MLYIKMLGRSVIDAKYIEWCSNPSDIYEHMPTLARYGSQCNHITECGVRSVISSYAFAHALKNKKDAVIVQVDTNWHENVSIFKEDCSKEGIYVIFYEASSLECRLEATDLLFIDTWHVYGQLKRELARWNSYVSKYIIMHDTTVDEWAGETIRLKWNPREQSEKTGIPVHEITKGLWPAIREFLASHPEWKMRERYGNNNGLTILERCDQRGSETTYPISFGIPKCKIVEDVPVKTQVFANCIAGKIDTYTFESEKDYYADYGRSVFGHTKRKGGWDCLRHYEILANGSIPYFENLSDCPKNTMTHLPKDVIMSAMNEINVKSDNPLEDNPTAIQEYSKKLLDYTRQNLTTEKMAAYILNKSNNSDAKSVLYLSSGTDPDYLRCLMLHGFKELLKANCHDSPRIPHLYTDFDNPSSVYGRGFSYTCLLDPNEYRDSANDADIVNDIKNKKYDVVVYGSIHRGAPHWDIVNEFYPKNKIILLCGEDGCTGSCKSNGKIGYHTFIRELK